MAFDYLIFEMLSLRKKFCQRHENLESEMFRLRGGSVGSFKESPCGAESSNFSILEDLGLSSSKALNDTTKDPACWWKVCFRNGIRLASSDARCKPAV